MPVIGNTALSFSEEQAMLLDVAREFCENKSPSPWCARSWKPRAVMTPGSGMKWWRWAGWHLLPESCGGSGMGVATVVPVVEAMGRAMLGTPLISTTLAAQLLLRAGGEARMEGVLSDIAAGTTATVALLENTGLG